MAQTRPFETLYGASRYRPSTRDTALCIGRACSVTGAFRGAITKMRERNYMRADIYNDVGTWLYTITRSADAIQITRKRGERL
jgi:hypothetical protein